MERTKGEITHKFRWFWAWQDDKEEEWLGEMSRLGLHLEKTEPFGFYSFTHGKPSAYIYRLDFQSGSLKGKEDYFQLFRDAGWEWIGNMGGWQYFRKESKADETPEIFTDNESKIAKYKRLLGYALIFLPIYTSTMVVWTGNVSPFIQIFRAIFSLVMILLLWMMVKVWLRIRQLQKL